MVYSVVHEHALPEAPPARILERTRAAKDARSQH